MLQHLNPTNAEDLVWDSDDLDTVVPAGIHAVTDSFNLLEYESTMKPLRSLRTRDRASGVEYARITNPGDSQSTAIVHFNPFGNGLSDNMLLRAAYCNKTFRAAGVKDEHGKPMPLITMSAPSGTKRLKLHRRHHKRIARGQFDTLALHHLQIIKDMGYCKIAIIGFSQGASLAVAAAAVAYKIDITVTHLVIGEPANVVVRTKRQLARHFMDSGKHLPKAVEATNMHILTKAHSYERHKLGSLKLLRQISLNYSLIKGLSLSGFEAELGTTLAQKIPVTLSYGDLTTISPPDDLRRTVAKIRALPDYRPHSLQVVEITGGHHAWADTLNLLATYYAYGLLR